MENAQQHPRLVILKGGPMSGTLALDGEPGQFLNTHLHLVACDKLPSSGGHSKGSVRTLSYVLTGWPHAGEAGSSGAAAEYTFEG
jgi:hypothetical protein